MNAVGREWITPECSGYRMDHTWVTIDESSRYGMDQFVLGLQRQAIYALSNVMCTQ